MTGSYVKNMLSFVRNRQVVYQSAQAILHSHQQWMTVLVDPHPCQHLILSVLWISSIPISKWWYFSVLICIFLMTYYVEHIFTFLISICYIFFNDVPVQIFCPFLNQVFIFLLLNFMTSLYILDNNLLSDVFQKYFFLICYLSFESLDGAFHRAGIFNYNQVQTTNIFFHM